VAYPKTIKSFVRRAGRTTSGQTKAFDELGPKFLLPYQPAPLDFVAAFANAAGPGDNENINRPTVLETVCMGRHSPQPRCCRAPTFCAAKCMNPAWARCSSALVSKI
jgi:hypothetical protein